VKHRPELIRSGPYFNRQSTQGESMSVPKLEVEYVKSAKADISALYERLKGFDSQALAYTLATVIVEIKLGNVITEMLYEEVKANSAIARKNKAIKTRNNKLARLKEICGKKNRTKAENVEGMKLAKELKLDREDA
jgi:hypothetical protein